MKRALAESLNEAKATVESDFSEVRNLYTIPAYLDSILFNLMSNAVKYRDLTRNLVIKIKTQRADGNVCITMRDNGIGIDLGKSREKLFNLYQRFHDHVEGKGLGLFLVKTQVEALNGKIDVESKVNEGTTFTITMPMKTTNSRQ